MTTLADVRAACRLTIAATAIVDDYAGRSGYRRHRAALPLACSLPRRARVDSGLHGRHAGIRATEGHRRGCLIVALEVGSVQAGACAFRCTTGRTPLSPRTFGRRAVRVRW